MSQAYKVGDRGSGKSCVAMKAANKQMTVKHCMFTALTN